MKRQHAAAVGALLLLVAALASTASARTDGSINGLVYGIPSPLATEPGEHNINNQLKTFIAEGGKVFCCRFGLSLHGAREEDLIEGVIPTHPLDVQDALIHYARKGAIINSTYQL